MKPSGPAAAGRGDPANSPPGGSGATDRWPVAILGPFPPYRGGIAQHTALLARTLAVRHPVRGISFKRLYPGFLFPGRTQFDPSATSLVAADWRVERLLDSIGPHTWPRTATAVTQAGCRLLLVQWWHPFFAPAVATVGRALRRQGVRSIFICHNVLPHEASRLSGALVRIGLGAADACIVHSETDREALLRLFPRKPHLLTPLPAFDIFAHGRVTRDQARHELQLQGPVVLFFGLVRPYKGLDVLLHAIARARAHRPMTLLVVGEFYEDRARYERLRTELGLDDCVRFVDRYVPNDEVEPYFRAADIVVLPYKSATQSAIVQVALTFERPAIVTRVGGLPESVRVGETGDVVPPEDPAALARSLLQFFGSDAAERMQPHLRRAAAAFSWDAMDAAVLALERQLGLPAQ